MSVIFSQVLILFTFIAIGYILVKANITKSEYSQILSNLLVYVFLPCNIFKTFSKNFTVKYITSGYKIILISTVILLLLLIISHFLAKAFSKEKYERCIYEYSLIVPNYGYIGYALADALLGEAGLVNIMAFALPVSIYIYTIGFAKLTKRGMSLKKLCNPIIIATILGIILGLSGFQIPNVFLKVITRACDCTAPISMLLTGIVIAQFPFKNIIFNAKTYFLTSVRLILIPLLLSLILKPFCDLSIIKIVVLFYALPCGLNTVVFPKSVNENCEIGAGLALVSTTLSGITLPIILGLFSIGE